MADLEKPLDREDMDRIEQAIAETNRIEAAIKRAQSAGIDVTDRLEETRQVRNRLESLKRVYGRDL